MVTKKQEWLNGRVGVLLDELDTFHLDVSRSFAERFFLEKLAEISNNLGISEASAQRYVSDDIVRDLARTMATTLVDERPGADMDDVARDVVVPMTAFGRLIQGLAVCNSQRLETEGIDLGIGVIAELGHVLSTTDAALASTGIPVQGALLRRAAGRLEQTADRLRERGVGIDFQVAKRLEEHGAKVRTWVPQGGAGGGVT